MGAILATIDRDQVLNPVEALEVELNETDAKWIGVPWNESASAVTVAVRLKNQGAHPQRQHRGVGNGKTPRLPIASRELGGTDGHEDT